MDKRYYRMSCPNHSMSKMGLEMDYLFVKRIEDSFNEWSTISNCLFVLHKNSIMGSYKILPVTILNEACYNNKSIVIDIFKELFGYYSTEIMELLEFNKFNESELTTTSCIKFLIYSLNRFMMEVFIKELDFRSDEYIYDNANLEYSFGENFKKYFTNLEASQNTMTNIQNLVSQYKRCPWTKLIYKKIKDCFLFTTNKMLPRVIKRLAFKINDILFTFLNDAVTDTESVYAGFSDYTNQKISSFIYARF